MDSLTVIIRETAPLDQALCDLFGRHLLFTRKTNSACCVHSKDAAHLALTGARLFALEEDGTPVAMAAFVVIEPGHAEVKSMHVASAARGRGYGRILLDHLVSEARSQGLRRLSLETGSQPDFAAARKLYAKAGFRFTAPFGAYQLDPNSVFMTLRL